MSEILLVPHPMLRQKAKKIEKITKKDVELSKKMIKIMQQAPGVGLAANQIGVLKKIVTIHIQNEEKNLDKLYTLFNPVILKYSKEKIILEEGCLSLPKQFAYIERPESITLQYTNEQNKIFEVEKNGFEARILQHEIDHLYGKLFVDYLSVLKRNILIKKVKKLIKLGEI